MSDAIKEVVREMLQHANSNGGALGEPAYAHTLRNWADRLAALAGAGPVAWMDSLLGNVSLPSEHVPGSNPAANGYIPLFTHAPAKAREVTEADVRKAVAAYNWAHYSGIDICCEDSMRAALATFAEGE